MAALIGGQVKNTGTISVPMGKVGLGSGEAATLDVSGDGFLQVAVPTQAGGKAALIHQSGTISAAGGTVVLTAATARSAARNAINISGTIDAHSISGHTGSIVIGGGAGGSVRISGKLNTSGGKRYAGGSIAISGNKVKLAGTIKASGKTGGTAAITGTAAATLVGHIEATGNAGTGGMVTVTADHVALQGATVDVSGTAGGGTVLIGGNEHGAGPLANALTTTIDASSLIAADATLRGDGGTVVVWSDRATSFAGLITARGGPTGGDGGQTEVSSHGLLDYTGLATLTAPRGAAGTLLLDPYNVVISSGSTANESASGSTTVTYTPNGTSVINAATLNAQLATANVGITTGVAGSADAGNITVSAPLSWTSGAQLTLIAANAIAVNAPITLGGTTGAGLNLSANALAINAPITVDGAGGINLSYNTASSTNLSFGLTDSGFAGGLTYDNANGSIATNVVNGQVLWINSTPYALIYSMTQLAGLSGPSALAANLTSSTTYGGPVIASLNYTLEGLGHTISNLTISDSTPGNVSVGLVGFNTVNGTVRDIGLIGGSVSGTYTIGGLVGKNAGKITQTFSTGRGQRGYERRCRRVGRG